MVSRVQEVWTQENKVGMLLIEVKGAFNHVSRNCLPQTMEKIDAGSDLIRWTESFKSNRNMNLVIDGPLCKQMAVDGGVPQ